MASGPMAVDDWYQPSTLVGEDDVEDELLAEAPDDEEEVVQA